MLYLNASHKPPVALLIEDEPLIAFDMAEALRDVGLDPVMQFNCAMADAWLRDHRPDVAIVDVNLNDGICVNTAQTLVERHVPFIVHSGDILFAQTHPIFNAGRRIDKPCNSQDVAAAAMMMVLAADLSSAQFGSIGQAIRA
jgi:DNA-binding response OmpR family regulator